MWRSSWRRKSTTILNIIKLGGKDEQRSLLIIDNEIAKIRGEMGESSKKNRSDI